MNNSFSVNNVFIVVVVLHLLLLLFCFAFFCLVCCIRFVRPSVCVCRFVCRPMSCLETLTLPITSNLNKVPCPRLGVHSFGQTHSDDRNCFFFFSICSFVLLTFDCLFRFSFFLESFDTKPISRLFNIKR